MNDQNKWMEQVPHTDGFDAFIRRYREQRDAQNQTQAAVALVRDQVRAGTDEEVVRYGGLFPTWVPGMDYTAEDVVRYRETFYRVALAHRAQDDWPPDRAVTMFTLVQSQPGDGAVLLWMAGEMVAAGDIRIYDGASYLCLQPHTTLTGWEPPNTPSLWETV